MITQNPYRLLGVFANDSLRVRTANIAKMRAFFQISKSVSFCTDIEELLGTVNRTSSVVNQANDELFDDNKKVKYALFWFHRSDIINEATVPQLNGASIKKFVAQDTSSYSDFINNAVLCLIEEDYECASKNYCKFIECDSFISIFCEQIGLTRDEIDNKSVIRILITTLFENYPKIEWWTLFSKYMSNRSIQEYVMGIFESLAIGHINKCISFCIDANASDKGLTLAHNLKRETISDVRLLCQLEKDGHLSAESQLALDKLAEELLSRVMGYYESEKMLNEQSVYPTLQMVDYVKSLAHGSGIVDKVTKYKALLQKDIDELPPASIQSEVFAIKQHISDFCSKSDDIKWSLQLVADCVPSLMNIKSTLSVKSKHYIAISTKIADNAIYNLDVTIEHINDRDMTFVAKERTLLRQAWQLLMDLSVLNLDADFVSNKLNDRKEDVQNLMIRENVEFNDIHANISLMTEEDIYNECKDYKSLMEFVKKYPASKYVDNALLRIRKIENDDFPKVLSVSALFAYKRKYPNSNKDGQVRQALYDLLLKDKYGTLNDYQTLLHLYAYNPPIQRAEIYKRIDFLKYSQCRTLLDYQQFVNNNPNSRYINDAMAKMEDFLYEDAVRSKNYEVYLDKYPNGVHANELREKSEFDSYNSCKTKRDYEKYVQKFPNGRYTVLAKNTIKRMNRKPLIAVSCIVVIVLLVGGIVALVSNRNSSTSISKPSVNASQKSGYGLAEEPDESEVDTSVDTIVGDETSEYDTYIDNSLETGSKPYRSQLGKARTGRNYLTFKTSGDNDFVVIVKRASDNKYINHTYIRGGDDATLYLPNGRFNIFFYSGRGWNPDKLKGNLAGGFVSGESLQKDGPINMHDSYGEYTLYPVENGNLQLQSADDDDAF